MLILLILIFQCRVVNAQCFDPYVLQDFCIYLCENDCANNALIGLEYVVQWEAVILFCEQTLKVRK